MKQYKLILTEIELKEIENMIGEIPTKFGHPIISLIFPKLQEIKEEPKPKEDVK